MKEWKWMRSNGDSAVILLHAYTGNPNNLTALARAINRLGMDVLLPLLPGHGTRQVRDLLSASFSDYQKCVDQAYQLLKDSGKKWIAVGGLSLGGLLSLDALTRLDLDACLSMAAPLGEASLKLDGLIHYFQNLAHQMACFDIQDEEIEEYLIKLMPDENELVRRLTLSSRPIFIAQGAKDELLCSDRVREVIKTFPNDELDFHWYPNSPHILTTGPDRMVMREDIKRFLLDNEKGH